MQLVRAEPEHFVEGILDLTRLEMIEKLLDDTLEEALGEMEGSDELESLYNKFAGMGIS